MSFECFLLEFHLKNDHLKFHYFVNLDFVDLGIFEVACFDLYSHSLVVEFFVAYMMEQH